MSAIDKAKSDQVEPSLRDKELDAATGGAGIAWVSGRGGTRGVTSTYDFLLEVAGVTPDQRT